MKKNDFIISLKDDEKVIQDWNESGEVIYRVVKNTLPKTWEEVLAWHCMQLAHGDAWHAYKALSCKLPKGNSRECVELYSTIMLKMVIEALNDGWEARHESNNDDFVPYDVWVPVYNYCQEKLSCERVSLRYFKDLTHPLWLMMGYEEKCKHLIKYFPDLVKSYLGVG